jgi:hypothetical protein
VWPEKCDECKKHNDKCSEPQAPNRIRTKTNSFRASQRPVPSHSDNHSTHRDFSLPIGTPDAGQGNQTIGYFQSSIVASTGPSSGLSDIDSRPMRPGTKTKDREVTKDGKQSQDPSWTSPLEQPRTRYDSESTIVFAGESISTGQIFGSNIGQDRYKILTL